MAVSVSYRTYLLEQMARVRPVTTRPMFGGLTFFAEGRAFALADDGVLYFKVDDSNRPDFVAAGKGPFLPFGDPAKPMQYFELRTAKVEDAALLADLGARTFKATFERVCSSKDMTAFLAKTYAEGIQRAELMDLARPARLLEIAGLPSGFLQVRLGHREPGVLGERPVELQRIYLLRSAQGRGYGKALMLEAEAMARSWGADVLWLGVWENNHRARAFYLKCGFCEVGEHLFKIGEQVDRDLILAKRLA